jgi:integrase
MIEKRSRRGRDGKAYQVYRVRWRDDQGKERSRTLPRGTRKAEAEAFELRVMTLKRGGDLPELDRGRVTLADYAERWWLVHAEPNLAESTLERYAQVWETHALEPLGDYRLRELRPELLASFRNDLTAKDVGDATIRKVFVVLQKMLGKAAEEGELRSNPAQLVEKPKQERDREPVVVPPLEVERLRRNILEENRYKRGARDATLVSLLAYAGLRPWSEGAELVWAKLRQRTIVVYAPKTRRARSVDLLEPLRLDLARYRIDIGGADEDALVFPGPRGGAWSRSDVGNWRRRIWRPALEACGMDTSMVPYALRHSFASLLLHEGRLSLSEVAEQMGHSVAVLSSTYAHVLGDLRGGERQSAEATIEAAREKVAAEGWKPREAAG